MIRTKIDIYDFIIPHILLYERNVCQLRQLTYKLNILYILMFECMTGLYKYMYIYL